MTEVLASRVAGLKLSAIVAVLMLPMALLTALMVNGLRSEIASAERELSAVALSRLVMPVMLDAAGGNLAEEATGKFATGAKPLADAIGVEHQLQSALSDLRMLAVDVRHAVASLARLQAGIVMPADRAGEAAAEARLLGEIFAGRLPDMLVAYAAFAVQREGTLRDGRVAGEEAAALLLSAGNWLEAHRKLRDALQQARELSTSFVSYDAPLRVMREMIRRPRHLAATISRSLLADMAPELKNLPAFGSGSAIVLTEVRDLWTFAIDRYETLQRQQLASLTQRLYWMLGLAVAASLFGVGGAAMMFRSTLRQLDDVKHARDEAEAARRENEAVASELQRVNEEVIRLNADLSQNLRLLRETQEENIRRGKMVQLGQLTATVAHELRNPLGAVRTSVFLLERKLKGKALGIEPQLERINNGVTRCDNIISQLLDFARTKALNLEEVTFDDWLAKVVQEEAERLPAEIAIECVLGLGDFRVRIDPARMTRVFVNLLSNAAEAMVGKGDDLARFTVRKPLIIVTSAQTARGIEVSVRDNGPGIPPENLERIFEPLFTTKNFGTGLGLPAVRRILEQHGGGLEVHSALGQGATFTAWWPLVVSSQEAA